MRITWQVYPLKNFFKIYIYIHIFYLCHRSAAAISIVFLWDWGFGCLLLCWLHSAVVPHKSSMRGAPTPSLTINACERLFIVIKGADGGSNDVSAVMSKIRPFPPTVSTVLHASASLPCCFSALYLAPILSLSLLPFLPSTSSCQPQ